MGFFDSLFGGDQADAARAAAADTDAKQQKAISALMGYGDQYRADYADLSKAYDPYVRSGLNFNDALNRLISDPSSVRSLPGYQFAQGEGIQALDRSAAARGMLNSGRQSKDLLRFGTGLADQTYGNQLARLMAGNAQGQSATGAQVGTVGQGMAGQLATRQSAYTGQMANAPVWGQGQIAGANAEAAGANNILGTALNIGGKIAAFL